MTRCTPRRFALRPSSPFLPLLNLDSIFDVYLFSINSKSVSVSTNSIVMFQRHRRSGVSGVRQDTLLFLLKQSFFFFYSPSLPQLENWSWSLPLLNPRFLHTYFITFFNFIILKCLMCLCVYMVLSLEIISFFLFLFLCLFHFG